ncbi:MAG: hypothetical protein R2764_19440 [Bacteroidales bacterium]
MKKFIILLLLATMAIIATAQPPEAFNYQAVVRNATGDLTTSSVPRLCNESFRQGEKAQVEPYWEKPWKALQKGIKDKFLC